MDELTRRKLDNANWEEILPRVLKYAVARVKKYRLLGVTDMDPEDLVHEAISLAYGARADGSYRKWNQESYPDLTEFLISIISSLTSHKSRHLKRFKHKYFGRQETGRQDPLETEALSSHHVCQTPNPEQLLLQEHRAKEIVERINSVADQDEEMRIVLSCLEEGITKPGEIAARTGYEVRRVYNILRRIRRNLEEIR